MTIFQAFILGIIQGATEFLPISSSGHLVLFPHVMGWEIPTEQAFVFDVLVQLGTLLAVIVYFWTDLWNIVRVTFASLRQPNLYSRPDLRLGANLLVATAPAVGFGIFFKETIEAAFSNSTVTALLLLLTALLLFIAEWVGKRNVFLEDVQWYDALRIGVFQALALFPGVSRSGASITGGMVGNMKRLDAARFSFLMAVPVMIGAGVLAAFDLSEISNLASFAMPMLVGFATSAVVGFLAIRWLLNYLAKNSLYVFSIYLVVISTLALILG
jgi:undecaprenyl-diphosphatase